MKSESAISPYGELNHCPLCLAKTGHVVEDHKSGDVICADCGFILDRVIDESSEKRNFASDKGEEHADPSRAGFSNPLYDGNDLTTSIESSSRDARLLGMLQSRTAGNEKYLEHGFREITIMGDKLLIIPAILRRAKILFRDADRKINSAGNTSARKVKQLDAMASSCLYIACRQEGVPRSFKEICAVSKVSKKVIGRCYKSVSALLETSTAIVTTMDFLSRFCSNLDLELSVQNTATGIAEGATALSVAVGKSPISVASAAIYMAVQLHNVHKSAASISEVCGAAEATLRISYKVLYAHRREVVPQSTKYAISIDQLQPF